MSTICQGCNKKVPLVVGNLVKMKWLCQRCNDSVDETGELPKDIVEKAKKIKK